MLEKKECFMEKLFLATFFENKTKVFSENFGW